MDVLVSLVAVFFLFLVLIKAADKLVVVVRKFSSTTHVKGFVVASVLVSITTTLPELFVGINSALAKVPALSLGNVMGSNIANISLVLGLAGFFGGVVYIKNNELLQREFLIAFLAGLLPVVLFLDKSLSRLDGLVLILGYVAYSTGFFHGKFFSEEKESRVVNFWQAFLKELTLPGGRMNLVRFFVSAAVLLFASNLIVRLTTSVAQSFGIPLFLIGLLFLSIGTVLPELAFSYRSLSDHEPGFLVGNRLGAVVANSLLVLGILSLIHPFEIAQRGAYGFSVAVFAIAFFLFWLFTKTKSKIARWEAVTLLALYVVFAFVELAGFGIFKLF